MCKIGTSCDGSVVHWLICKTCDKQYIGNTLTAFRLRFNKYKSQFRSFCECQNAGTLHRKEGKGRVVPY